MQRTVQSWLFAVSVAFIVHTRSCANKIIKVVGAGFKTQFKESAWSAFYPLANLCFVAPCVSESGLVCRCERLFQLLALSLCAGSQSSALCARVFVWWFFTIAKLERADCVIIRLRVACECAYLREKTEKGYTRSRQITKVNAIVCFINPLPLYARKRNCSCSLGSCVWVQYKWVEHGRCWLQVALLLTGFFSSAYLLVSGALIQEQPIKDGRRERKRKRGGKMRREE